MGGQIDWAAIPIIVDLLSVPDVDIFIAELVAIRAHFEMRQEHGSQ